MVNSNALERSFDFERFKSPEFTKLFHALDEPAKAKLRHAKAEAEARSVLINSPSGATDFKTAVSAFVT